MLKKKQVVIIMSIAVVSFLIGTTFNVVTTATDSSGNPWDRVWTAIYGLEERLDNQYSKTIRFVETNETFLEVPASLYYNQTSSSGWKNASRVFTWTPTNSSNNVLLSVNWYFEFKTNLTESETINMTDSRFTVLLSMICDESSLTWSQSVSKGDFDIIYKKSQLFGPTRHAPDCVNYKFWFRIQGYQSLMYPFKEGQPYAVYVKNLNVIITVADGIPPSNP